jgi:hypothetical protein
VHQMIVPFRSRGTRNATFNGTADQVKKASNLMGSLGRDSHGNESDQIFGAIEEIAMHLAWFGEALYEIVPSDPPTLQSFLPERVLKFPMAYLQIVPRQDYLVAKRRFVLLRSRMVLRIAMPQSLGGAMKYKRILKGLRKISSAAPPFWLADLEAKKHDNRFSFKEYVWLKTVHIASLTAKWGWNRRDYGNEYGTEFLAFYRTLTFKKAQALLREHIVSELNNLLRRMKIKATIELHDITLASRIEGLIEEVLAGRLHYAEALRSINPS